MIEGAARAEIQTTLWVIGGLVVSNLGFFVGLVRWPIRSHLRRIAKIERDLSAAHAKIRELEKSHRPKCEFTDCPLCIERSK